MIAKASNWKARVPGDREERIYHQRTVEGLSLQDIADHHGIGYERVRQLLRHYYRLTGFPPAVRRREKKDREALVRERREKLVRMIARLDKPETKDLVDETSLSISKLGTELRALVRDGRLERIGSRQRGYYKACE